MLRLCECGHSPWHIGGSLLNVVMALLIWPRALCSTALGKLRGKLRAQLLSAALQNRLTAGLCHCNDTYESLLFIQQTNDPTPFNLHCNTNLHSNTI